MKAHAVRRTIASIAIAAALLQVPPAAFAADPPRLFADHWIDGTAADEPATQVQRLDDDTFVIRQSVKTNFEAPFLYLLFGRNRALLIDSGAKGGVIRPTVDRLVAEWLARNRRASVPLTVAHSHAHGDHIASDAAFRERPDTVVVGLKPEEVAAYFGIGRWPDQIGTFDLGGRKLSVIPTPGHQTAAIMVYDPKLGLLFSGDSLYPGRLYIPVNFMADARASIDRLAAFAADHRIRAVLGAHIEMTRKPGQDYVQAVTAHPDESPLELPAASIAELRQGLTAPLDAVGQRQVHDRFIIVTVPSRTE